MNIILVSPFDLYVSRLWGPTMRLHCLAKELCKMGHRAVLAGPRPKLGETPALLDGVPLHYFAARLHRYPYNDGSKSRKRNLPGVIARRSAELLALIRRQRVDVLICNRAFPETAYPCYAAHLLSGVPLICDWDDIEGLHGFSTAARNRLSRQLFETVNEVLFPRLADATVVSSRYIEQFATQINTDPSRLFYAPTVADGERFHPGVSGEEIRKRYGLQGRKVLLYSGNLMKSNGIQLQNVIVTMKRLVAEDPDYRLLIVGGGDLIKDRYGAKGELLLLTERFQLTDHVIFTGSVPSTEVARHLAAADVCLALFPINVITMSKSPLKAYEYMAAGRAMIAREIGELQHCVVDGETGRLVRSDNPEEYVQVIQQLFSEPERIREMGEAARRLFERRFTWAHSAEVVVQACRKVARE